VGDWHVVVLNSNCSKVGGCSKGSPQERWLRTELAAHPNSCTLAYFHHPLFSSGEHGNNPSVRSFWEALYEANADVVLSGHDHTYERFAPQDPYGALNSARGIREFVVGTGGRSYYPFKTIKANSEARIANTDGLLKLTLNPSRYYWEFVPVAGQTPTDSGSAACHGSDTQAPEDTNIDSGPSGIANDASATFGFSYSEAGASFECSLDGSAFDACTSPQEYPDLADGPHTFEVRAIDAAGNVDPTPASRAWVVDTAAPVAQPPAQSLTTNSTLGTSTVPIKLAWSATDSGSGVDKYQLQRSTNGDTYADEPLSKATTTSKTVSLAPGNAYQFRMRATDRAGSWSEWAYGPEFVVEAHQETSGAIIYSGTWTQQAESSPYGGWLKYAGVKGYKAQLSFTGRNVAWVAPKGAGRGKAEVWVDGVKVRPSTCICLQRNRAGRFTRRAGPRRAPMYWRYECWAPKTRSPPGRARMSMRS
jgi:Calcineurin-like phosphoesterase